MQAVTGLAFLHAAAMIMPSLPFQLVTFVIFTVFRAAIFSLFSVYVARTFG